MAQAAAFVGFSALAHLDLNRHDMSGDAASNLDDLWAECKAFYKARYIRDRFTHMRLSMFCQPSRPFAKFPRLRGKAAEVRQLGAPLLEAWQKRRGDSVLHRQVEYLMRRSVKLEDMLSDNKELVLYPPALAEEFRRVTEEYLQMYSAVARAYGEAGRMLFDVTPKHHMLWHAADSAKWLNPCRVWCYMGEDNMQVVRRLGTYAMRAVKPHRVGARVLRKWVRGYSFRFTPQGQWLAPARRAG